MKIPCVLIPLLGIPALTTEPAPETQQDLIACISRINIRTEGNHFLKLNAGSISGKKVFIKEVKDLKLKDSKGNELSAYPQWHSYFLINGTLTDSVSIYIESRIRGARITVTGTLELEIIPFQQLQTVHIPINLEQTQTHVIDGEEFYIYGDSSRKSENGETGYNAFKINSKHGSLLHPRFHSVQCLLPSTDNPESQNRVNVLEGGFERGFYYDTHTFYSYEQPLSTFTLKVSYWPEGETVYLPFSFTVSLGSVTSNK